MGDFDLYHVFHKVREVPVYSLGQNEKLASILGRRARGVSHLITQKMTSMLKTPLAWRMMPPSEPAIHDDRSDCLAFRCA